MGKPKAKPKRGSAKGSEKVVSKNITNKHDINTILDKVYFVITFFQMVCFVLILLFSFTGPRHNLKNV